MTVRSIPSKDLSVGMTLALPMGRTAVVTDVNVGTVFVNLVTAEYGKTRVGLYSETLIEVATPPACEICGSETDKHYDEECFK